MYVYILFNYVLMIKDQYLVDRLKQNDLKTLDKVYLTYKEDFFLFAHKLNAPADDIADIYQETIINLYENVQNGKLEKLTSTLKSYVFAIGKFKIYRQLNENKKLYHEEHIIHISEEMQLFEAELHEEQQAILKKSWKLLGSKCQEILELFYYKGMTLDEIQETLQYSSKDVLKSQKSRCVAQLKELAKERYESARTHRKIF
ncbi:hypothetical protein GCM10009122_23770 [Fulvivirga kasyanovii]